MICPICRHEYSEHRSYGCAAIVEEEACSCDINSAGVIALAAERALADELAAALRKMTVATEQAQAYDHLKDNEMWWANGALSRYEAARKESA